MVGKTISHYKILEKLGEGGMGTVYKAEDTKLDRFVALKFLALHLNQAEEDKKRFTHEAKAASALDHPNICTIYEINEAEDGRLFIAMAFYDGESVKEKIECGPLPLEQAIDTAIRVAEGLARAHERKIVHRDIKPANIMVTSHGEIKIVDFGLAKLVGRTKLTKTGTALGTVAYMSPEQLQGEETDRRTDIWALGSVLYEMVGGRPPFQGDYEQAVMYAIMSEEPEALTALRTGVPMELERIVNKALSKNPDERYQYVEELRTDLKALRKTLSTRRKTNAVTAGTSQRQTRSLYGGIVAVVVLLAAIGMYFWQGPGLKKAEITTKAIQASIAVLPFADMSQQKDQEYFCDGMAEELTNALAKLKGLRVVSRTSAFQFREKAQGIREIGEQLRVSTVLEGSVRKAGEKLRITAQLINVEDGYRLWSETFDREMKDVFAIQEEIARAIVTTLQIQLVGEADATLVKKPTENLEAYTLYLNGRYHFNRRHGDAALLAVDYYQQAIERDSSYALAYSGLADAYIWLGIFSYLASEEAGRKAKANAMKAFEIDSTLGEVHTTLGAYNVAFAWNWAAAERHFKRAIELNPNYQRSYLWYGWMLGHMGRYEEMLTERKRALALDPVSPLLNIALGRALYHRGQRELAINHFRKAIELDPNYWMAHNGLGRIFVHEGMLDEALILFQKAVAISQGSPKATGSLGHTYAVMGNKDEAGRILAELKSIPKQAGVPFFAIALIYLGLGENEQAFAWLERAYQERYAGLVNIAGDIRFMHLRTDPRYIDLLRRMGLSEKQW